MNHLVTLILLAPMAGLVLLLLVPETQTAWIRRIASTCVTVSLILATYLLLRFDHVAGGFQFLEQIPWIDRFDVSYLVGLDGVSVVLVWLHALCSYTGVLISYSIKERVKEYFVFYLLLITGVFGVFVSLDIFFFYLFYEMAVIPMYPLIGIWGSTDKEYATMKLTLYLTSGAVLALIGLLSVYSYSGINTFSLLKLIDHLAVHPLPAEIQRWAFPMLLFGFGIIAPMWPFHSWSPIGHAAAPSAVSMLHAGVLMKLGSYAIIRLALTLMPEGAAQWMPVVAVLCVFNIIYGGWVAMSQKDTKFIVGYSSSSHMGYVLLGLSCLNSLGLGGSVLLMFAHGIMTALAFALIGFFYDQTHNRMVPELGGLAKKMPFIATCFVLMSMASSGLPGFSNFVSELLIFFAAWEKYPVQTILAVFGVVITATYMLRAIRGIFFGPITNPQWEKLRDARTFSEKWPYLVLLAALIVTGFWPNFLLRPIEAGIRPIVQRLEQTNRTQVAQVKKEPARVP